MRRALLATTLGLLAASAPATTSPALAQTEPDGPQQVTGTILEPAARPATPERIAGLKLPPGLKVSVAARRLGNARMLAVGPNRTVYVTRREQGDVLALSDRDRDGTFERRRTVARGLPFLNGIARRGSSLYLVTDQELYRGRITRDGGVGRLEVLTRSLPDAGQHPNRTLAFGPDGALYVTVGSTCNACVEPDPRSATILRGRPDGTRLRVYARGLRNTIGFDWHPRTRALWGMDHGTDWRGDDQPPEELNRIVRGGNYGWPFCFADGQLDNALPAEPQGVSQAGYCAASRPAALTYTAHAAPIGFAFQKGTGLGAAYRGDAFVAMRGSWNRGRPSGYEVVRVDFEGGRPVAFEPFLTGFLVEEGRAQFARLAGLVIDRDGSLLVADDSNGVLYRVSAEG